MNRGKLITNLNQIKTIACRDISERETVVNISGDDDKMVIYTSENTMMTKLKKCIQDNPKDWKCYEGPFNKEGEITGYFIEAPKNYLSFRIGKNQISEEVRQKASERFKEMAKEGKLGRKAKA